MDKDELDRLIGRRIRIARQFRKLSQTDLGEAVGVTFQQVQKYESGANRVSASRLFRVAKALEVDIKYFFNEEANELGDLNRAGNSIDENDVRSIIESLDIEEIDFELLSSLSQIRQTKKKNLLRSLVKVLSDVEKVA